MSRRLIFAILAMAILATFVNVKVRYDQWQVWKANPSITEIAGAMSFSTADAPYFLGHAAMAKEGLPNSTYELSRRVYKKRLLERNPEIEQLKEYKRPLLSSIISNFAVSPKIADLLRASHMIGLICAGSTALMIIFAFGAIGYWLEGTVAAIGGGLSASYLVRSSFGRIDTDQLNLGFIYFLFGLVFLSARSESLTKTIFWCVITGVVGQVFLAWYEKPELLWIVIFVYLFLLLAHKRQIFIPLLCLSILYAFLLIPIPSVFTTAHFQDTIVTGSLIFPNTFDTVTEARKLNAVETMKQVAGSWEMGAVCFSGLVVWAMRHPLTAIAYSPLIMFALLNFFIGNRAIFFSAPIVWFGFGFLMSSTAKLIWLSRKVKNLPSSFNTSALTVQVSVTLMSAIIAVVNSPINYLPRPSFPSSVIEGFASLKSTANRREAVVATWWDYGYASLLFNRLPTLHDGSSQTGPVTHLVAKALLSPNQKTTVKILQFLSTSNPNIFRQITTSKELYTQINGPATTSVPDVYLVLSDQMAGWIGSISKLSNWDIETGTPIIPQGNNGTSSLEYIGLDCNYRGYPLQANCGDLRINFDEGLSNEASSIVGWAHARDGFAKDVHRYDEAATLGVQTLQINKRLFSQIMHRQLFDSSFNKLYHLGVIETAGITLVYDNYPHIRIYKIVGRD